MSRPTKKQKEQMEFEIQFIESVLEKVPTFIEALMALGDLYSIKEMHAKAFDIDKRLTDLRPSDPMVLYNLACDYSLMNNLPEALNTIKKAIEHGYDDFEFMENDEDLGNLLKDRHFREFISKLKKQKNRAFDKPKQPNMG